MVFFRHNYIGKKPIEIRNRLSSGIIESSLWNTLVNNNLSPALVVELEASRKKDEERDQKIQAIFEMTERIYDIIMARFNYRKPKEGEYLVEIDD